MAIARRARFLGASGRRQIRFRSPRAAQCEDLWIFWEELQYLCGTSMPWVTSYPGQNDAPNAAKSETCCIVWIAEPAVSPSAPSPESACCLWVQRVVYDKPHHLLLAGCSLATFGSLPWCSAWEEVIVTLRLGRSLRAEFESRKKSRYKS